MGTGTIFLKKMVIFIDYRKIEEKWVYSINKIK